MRTQLRVVLLSVTLAAPLAPYDINGRGDGFWKDLSAFSIRYAAFLEKLRGCPKLKLMKSIADCDAERGYFDEALWLGVDGAARRLFELPKPKKEKKNDRNKIDPYTSDDIR